MSKRISLNLELNQKLSRGSNNTPLSDRSADSANSISSKLSSVTTNGSRLRESITKTREMVRSRISGSYTEKSFESLNEGNQAKPDLFLKSKDKELERQNLTNKLNLKKYSTFLVRKMQGNEFLNSLLIDRTPKNSNLLAMIEEGDIEPALLLTLQLLCDVVVHCEGSLKQI